MERNLTVQKDIWDILSFLVTRTSDPIRSYSFFETTLKLHTRIRNKLINAIYPSIENIPLL